MCLRQQINTKAPGYPEASCFQRQMFWPTDKLLRSGFVQQIVAYAASGSCVWRGEVAMRRVERYRFAVVWGFKVEALVGYDRLQATMVIRSVQIEQEPMVLRVFVTLWPA